VNTIGWLVALIVLGLTAGWGIGMLLAFTGGRTSNDLVAGLVGAVVAGISLRLAGLTGFSDPLPTLIVGVSVAMLATWLTRIATWKAEPERRPVQELPQGSDIYHRHDMMTTSDGTRLLLSTGRLIAADLSERATQPTGPG